MTCHAARRVGEFEQRLRREREQLGVAPETTDAARAGRQWHEPGPLMDDAAPDTTRRLSARSEEQHRQVLADVDDAAERLAARS